MKYNKLVRDKIPQIIRQKGGKPIIHIATKKEYWQKLREKLKEEVSEFIEKGSTKEIADILEVIDAICSFGGVGKKKLLQLKRKRARERGRFKRRIILEES